jgi:hypothetical protein
MNGSYSGMLSKKNSKLPVDINVDYCGEAAGVPQMRAAPTAFRAMGATVTKGVSL